MNYRQKVERVLSDYAEQISDHSQKIETHLLFDRDHEHYQVLQHGWYEKYKQAFRVIIHVDIIKGQIWIQRDMSEDGIATELLEAGIPQHDIVLGFHAPYKRSYTEFATGLEPA